MPRLRSSRGTVAGGIVGGVIEQMRNIALSTTVTLLVREERRAQANGLVGTVQGIAFIMTSVFSGLSVGILGSLFMIREWWVLYVVGIWLYMVLVPPVEAAEQTVIQKVVPYSRQGRVFGFAAAFEAAAAPLTAFLIAPLAEFWVIPYMQTDAGARRWAWLVGEGDARGIALICFFAGIVMTVAALRAFTTWSYRTLTVLYAQAPDPMPVAASETESDAGPDPLTRRDR